MTETNLPFQTQLHLSVFFRTKLPPKSLVGLCDERLTYKEHKTRKRGEPLKTWGKFSLSSCALSWASPIKEHWNEFQAAIQKRDKAIRRIAASSDQIVISANIEVIEEFPHFWFDPEFGRLLNDLGAEFLVSASKYP